MDFILRFDDKSRDRWRLYFPFSQREVHHRGRKFRFNRKNGEAMLSHFSTGVVAYDLPINLAHDDMAGVLGHIADMRVGVRGVEWKSSFSADGWAKAKKSGFKYCSPEVMLPPNKYTTAHGKSFTNVALGVALTARPRLGRALLFTDGTWRRNMKLDEFSVEKIQNLKVSELRQFVADFDAVLDELMADDPTSFDENLKELIEAHPGLYSAYSTIKMSGLAF